MCRTSFRTDHILGDKTIVFKLKKIKAYQLSFPIKCKKKKTKNKEKNIEKYIKKKLNNLLLVNLWYKKSRKELKYFMEWIKIETQHTETHEVQQSP